MCHGKRILNVFAIMLASDFLFMRATPRSRTATPRSRTSAVVTATAAGRTAAAAAAAAHFFLCRSGVRVRCCIHMYAFCGEKA